jgi:hypothetical protein
MTDNPIDVEALKEMDLGAALERLVVYTSMEDGQLALNCERVVLATIIDLQAKLTDVMRERDEADARYERLLSNAADNYQAVERRLALAEKVVEAARETRRMLTDYVTVSWMARRTGEEWHSAEDALSTTLAAYDAATRDQPETEAK